MPTLTVNHQEVSVPDGATVWDAAEALGLFIPTLCHRKDLKPITSCMLCVVKDASGRLLPSCSSPAEEGMVITTEDDEIRQARKDVLELLLSEHHGDCEAPCRRICPAKLDIPLMMRLLTSGRHEEAAVLARRDLALPNVLGAVCPAPCEEGCRRKEIDHPLTIRALHSGVTTQNPPARADLRPERVAVVGGGPAGLACAWLLGLKGYACTLFDETPQAGGALRSLPQSDLPESVLDGDIAAIGEAGVSMELGTAVDGAALLPDYAAVVVAATEAPPPREGLFFAKERSLVVGAVGNGKSAAVQVDRFLRGQRPHKPPRRFDSRLGRLKGEEVRPLVDNCFAPVAGDSEAAEAARCLRCDCRCLESCDLRRFSDAYGAKQPTYPAPERFELDLMAGEGRVVYEPGKCIKCGLCVRLAEREGDDWGLTYLGRGFETRIGAPFNTALHRALERSAAACVEICPTGALAFFDTEEREP